MLKLTKADQPTPTWKRVATLGGKHVRANATPDVAVVNDYMRGLRDPMKGELVAGQEFLDAVIHPDDQATVNAWPFTYDQWTDLGAECFGLIGQPDDAGD